jgi:hypothetical protein
MKKITESKCLHLLCEWKKVKKGFESIMVCKNCKTAIRTESGLMLMIPFKKAKELLKI